MRQRAAESDVVIVNHHLLCADAAVRQSSYGEVIPDCHYAVLDEAHQLEDVATQYFGIVGQQLPARRARPRQRAPAQRRRGRATRTATLRAAVARVDDHARAFFGGLAMARASARQTARNACASDRTGSATSSTTAWRSSARSTASKAAMALRGVERGTASGGNEDALTHRAPRRRDPRRSALPARGLGSAPTCTSSRRADAACSCAPRRSTSPRSSASMLFDRMRATVLTSATLAVDGSFEYVRGRLGIDGRRRDLRVPSEFDFAAQSLLYLPRRMPPPKSPGLRRRRGARGARDPAPHARPRVRALHQLRDDARGVRDW